MRLIVLAVGSAVLAGGIYLASRPVTCEGRAMDSGDSCEHYQGGRLVDTKSYDEERTSQELMAAAVLLIGSAGVLGVAVVTVRGLLPARRSNVRNPWAVLGLSVITLSVYAVFRWYHVNRELRDYGLARAGAGTNPIVVDPSLAVLALFPGGFVVVPLLVSVYRTGGRIREAQRLAGLEPRVRPLLGVLLYVPFMAMTSAYYQAQLNKVWRAEEEGASQTVPGVQPANVPAS